VLEQAVVHVDDVERAVGAVVAVDRAETLVGRGDELFFDVRVVARDAAVRLFLQHGAADEVGARLADEGVAGELVRE
jgi:hypothetical protein